MMQLNGSYFLSICSKSEGKAEAYLIQTSMNSSQRKTKLQVGIILVDVSKTYIFEISNPVDQCQYVCLPTFPPYREVGASLPFTSSALMLGWEAISNICFGNR
jgi:hypothetical protein